ncbi:PLC-like phosphodiesterase [Mycena alexandri]|uniref:PLC-like phosphodiesterase n=1 Tax=Mycena alexandri TaxID=1745969 RepID=A0AAD6TA60_9AGAR|nr:PLC-like phosphodiesterase [Mycena alexandri]
MLLLLISSFLTITVVCAVSQQPLTRPTAFDVQGHRGGRGNAVENTLPSFAWGLIDGATTLELDNGVTKDGVVVVWHDEEILAGKCQDSEPAFPNDSAFPYVGKYIANLTLAQVKMLDCGSKRQNNFPQQLTYPGTRISTLQEVFDFVECADPDHLMLWNIESKIDAANPGRTASVDTFVKNQHAVFAASPYQQTITYQSFDWRSLVEMKKLDPEITTSALVEYDTTVMPDNGVSPWLAGLNLHNFSGSSLGVRLAKMQHIISMPAFFLPAHTPLITRSQQKRWSIKRITWGCW